MEPLDPGHLNDLIEHNKNNAEQKAVDLRYHKLSTKRHVTRKVSPLALKGNLLLAFDHKRKAVRTFRMDRIKSMEKKAFWIGFEKRANVAAELVGLGTLAVPSVQSLRGKPMDDRTKEKFELAGLGTLAAPYAISAGKKLLTRGR